MFRESAIAHRYLDGLYGLEIGGSAHNPFGLRTKNVDLTDEFTIYKQEEVNICGKFLPVDIIAHGANIPVDDQSQDFVISSHVLEHFSDPISAMLEWQRVIRVGGYIFMIIPHKDRTFDISRPRTRLSEIISNYALRTTHEVHHPWVPQDVLDIVDWASKNAGLHVDICEVYDQDDKVGNGFTIILRRML